MRVILEKRETCPLLFGEHGNLPHAEKKCRDSQYRFSDREKQWPNLLLKFLLFPTIISDFKFYNKVCYRDRKVTAIDLYKNHKDHCLQDLVSRMSCLLLSYLGLMQSSLFFVPAFLHLIHCVYLISINSENCDVFNTKSGTESGEQYKLLWRPN